MRASGLTNGETVDPEREDAITSTLARMVIELRVVVALASDPVARVAALGDRERVIFRLSKSSYVDIDWNGLRLARQEPAGPGAEELSQLTHDHHIVRSALASRRAAAVERDAVEMVRSLVRSDRQTFRRLLDWAPLVETSAYVIVATLTQLLDGMRPRMLAATREGRGESPGLIRTYLRLNAMMGRANLLATTEGSSPWLVDMARSFAWHTWTPSIALTRERSLWLAMTGARAAAEFGPNLVADYLEVLSRSTHPTLAMDAIGGLTAIGLRHPSSRRDIARALRVSVIRARSSHDGPKPMVELGREQALAVLEGETEVNIRSGGVQFAFDEDPLDYAAATGFALISRLPEALLAPSWALIPNKAEDLKPNSFRSREMIARAWGSAGPSEIPSVLH